MTRLSPARETPPAELAEEPGADEAEDLAAKYRKRDPLNSCKSTVVLLESGDLNGCGSASF